MSNGARTLVAVVLSCLALLLLLGGLSAVGASYYAARVIDSELPSDVDVPEITMLARLRSPLLLSGIVRLGGGVICVAAVISIVRQRSRSHVLPLIAMFVVACIAAVDAIHAAKVGVTWLDLVDFSVVAVSATIVCVVLARSQTAAPKDQDTSLQ